MRKHKLLAGILAAALVVTSVPASLLPADKAEAAVTPVETTITKTEVSNPILPSGSQGTLPYGGDPSVLVDGDTVYLYTGRDSSTKESYYMLDWQCYSTKDLKTWKNEGVIMKADKQSIKWANTGTDAWAGQIEKYKGKYYFYYCTWDSTSSGEQSIGVAVADKPTGPFKDIGKPLVKGTTTDNKNGNWSNFNDIDPTVWVEKDAKGVEHRYLCWGNNKLFICELNENMISIKDVNGDGKITFGVQANGATSKTADIIEKNVDGMNFTEAPWIYRRKDTNGNPAGPYYLFYARNWREEMAYATTDNLMDGKLTYGTQLMPPTATSNTNHMAVFDFKGKTYFIYHNGSQPGGSGFRRTPCIAELHFKKDKSIYAIPETAIGITGDTPYVLYTNTGHVISHDNFTNSSADGEYPYSNIGVGTYFQPKKQDANWAIVNGKADPSKASYVSIQSENKPGLYLTVNDNNTVTLAQDAKYNVNSGAIAADTDTAKAQTFRTVKGLTDQKAVSFESVAKTGYYLCLDGGSLVVKALDDCDASANFYLNSAPASSATPANPKTTNDLTSLKIDTKEISKTGHTYNCTVTGSAVSVDLAATMEDPNGFTTLNGKVIGSSGTATIQLDGLYTKASLCVYSEDKKPRVTYTVIIKKDINADSITSQPVKTFDFNEATNNAATVVKGFPPAATTVTYKYTDGVKGKAIQLDGTYGLKLCDADGIGSNYSISYWMKPDQLNGINDPTLAAGLFSPEYWLNLSFGRTIWSKANGNYIDDAGTITYKENEWQIVTLTVKGPSAKLFVNGTLAGQGTIAADIMSQSGAAIYFGVNAWDAYFKGSLDDVKIYNNTLDDAEVAALAASMLKAPSEDPQPDPNKVTSTNVFSEGDITYPDAVSSTLPAENITPPNSNNQPPANTATVKKVTVKAANRKPGSKTVYLKKGGKVSLAATVTGTGKFSKSVTWKTSKKKVATVSSKGVVKAKAVGTAKITATSKADNKKKATITIKVSKKAVKNKKLKLKKTKNTLKVKKTYTIAIKSMTTKTTEPVTYKSSKKSVATVDKYGVIKAKKKGKATITVKCGKKTAKLKLTVKK